MINEKIVKKITQGLCKVKLYSKGEAYIYSPSIKLDIGGLIRLRQIDHFAREVALLRVIFPKI